MGTDTGHRTRDSGATRDAILDAALTVVARDGLRASRMEDVASEAGVSRQSVYYHFRSRDEVVSALIDRGLTDLATSIRASADNESIDEFVVTAVRFFAANQSLCRLLVTEMWGLAGSADQPRHIVDRAEVDIIAPVAARIALANEAGEAHCADPVLAARALMGQVTGVAFGPIVRNEPLDADPMEGHLRAYARAVLHSGDPSAPAEADHGDGGALS